MLRIRDFVRGNIGSVFPSLDDYVARARNLYDRDRTLQERFHSPQSLDFAKYIDTEAILYYREIQEVGVPFPSSREMLTVGGETDLRLFLSIGYGCYQTIKNHIPADLPARIKMLDFGIGCARTARFFFRDVSRFECFGCDVDERAMEYVRTCVPFVKGTVSRNHPPLPYEDVFFDVVYSISVFTHLNEVAFDAWLGEMHRVLRAQGLLLVTLHGQLAFSLVTTEPTRRKLIGIADEEFAVKRAAFADGGFIWMKQPVGSKSIDANQFGISFISRDRFEKSIAGRFDLVGYTEGEIGGWQDLAILRKMRV